MPLDYYLAPTTAQRGRGEPLPKPPEVIEKPEPLPAAPPLSERLTSLREHQDPSARLTRSLAFLYRGRMPGELRADVAAYLQTHGIEDGP